MPYSFTSCPPNQGKATTLLRIALVGDNEDVNCSIEKAFKGFDRDWMLHFYKDGQQALKHIPLAPPHAVLIDIPKPGNSGINCTRKLKHLLPNLPIVIFSVQSDCEKVLDYVIAGACGYLIKPVQPSEIVLALDKVFAGFPAFCPSAEKKMIHCLHSLGENFNVWQLTRREQEIITCIYNKHSDKNIAETIGIAPATVHVHMVKIFKKLGVHNRADAVRRFLEMK